MRIVVNFKKLVVLPLAVLSTACGGSSNLTRSTAAELIVNSKDWNPQVRSLRPNGFDNGVTLGLWSRSGEVRPEGRALVASVSRSSFTLANAAKLGVEVTGITEGAPENGVKEGKFTWNYADLPTPLRGLAVSGGNGRAAFRKYDDGWRLEGMNVEYVPDGSNLSASDRQSYEQAVSGLQALLAEASKKRTKLLSESLVPTKDIKEFTANLICNPMGEIRRSPPMSFKVTDVSLVIVNSPGAGRVYHESVGFGNLKVASIPDRFGPQGDAIFELASDGKPCNLSHFFLEFAGRRDRDQFARVVEQAMADWNAKYQDLVAARLP